MALVSDFNCSVCLDVFKLFTKPVHLPCGHSFWKVCITRCRDSDVVRPCFMCKYWDGDVPHHCPVCTNPCGQRPALCVNTQFSEMTAGYRRPPEGRPSSASDGTHRDAASPGEVPYDVSPERTALKRKAPDHVVNPMYMTKKVRTCKNHGEPLEIFCRSDQESICLTCLKTEHKAHDAVMLEEEYKRMYCDLTWTSLEAKRMIVQRQNRVHGLKKFIQESNEDAAKDKKSAIKLFGALAVAAKIHQAMVIEEMEERRRTAVEQAQGFMDKLEQDIAALHRKTTELWLSLHSEDHHRLLQTFQSISGIPEVLALSKVKGEGVQILRNILTKSVTKVEEMLHRKMEVVPRGKLMNARRRFALDVTLDPATATSSLVLSEDGKRVRARKVTSWTDNLFVLSKKGFYLTEIYYEVQVKGNTHWKLGVIEESFKRDRKQQECWFLQLENGNYSSHRPKRDVDRFPGGRTPPKVTTSLSLSTKPEKIAVLVNDRKHKVSFYNVDNGALLHRFTGCTFQERLYPMLWCNCDADDAPLIITPVVVGS